MGSLSGCVMLRACGTVAIKSRSQSRSQNFTCGNASGSRDLFPSAPSDKYGDAGTHLSDDGLALQQNHPPFLANIALFIHSSTFVRTKSLSVRCRVDAGPENTIQLERNHVRGHAAAFNPSEKENQREAAG
jgi:hypothetical protein